MQVVVFNGSLASDPYSITANAVQPGMLSPPAFLVNGLQYVAALLPDSQFPLPVGAIPGVASRPAKPGETLTIYGIGFGPVTPGFPAGTIVSALNTLVSSLQITFGTTPAAIAYDGLANGYVGLYQINVVVPNVPNNDAVPFSFSLGGIPGTPQLYIAVHQ